MAMIRVTQGGCGITYTDENGAARHALKTAESGPFECDVAQADRLVRLGVAAYVTTAAKKVKPAAGSAQEPDQEATQQTGDTQEADQEATQQTRDTQEPDQEADKNTGHLDAATLDSWDYNELKKLAAEMGVEPKGKKKADYIAAIVSVKVKPGDEDNTPPDLNAADPE